MYQILECFAYYAEKFECYPMGLAIKKMFKKGVDDFRFSLSMLSLDAVWNVMVKRKTSLV